MKILSVDTCLSSCSVSLHFDEKLINEIFLNNGFTHSGTLAPAVDYILKFGDIKTREIDLFGVTNGPGSFTGIRIGLALIKGMAIPNNTPCISISSLYAIALNARFVEGYICVCVDARNNQVYNSVYRAHKGEIEIIVKDRAILINDFVNELKEYGNNIFFVGDGAETCYNIAKSCLKNNDLVLLPSEYNYPRACRIGEKVFRAYNSGEICYGQDLVPQYLKLSQAERELQIRRSEKGSD